MKEKQSARNRCELKRKRNREKEQTQNQASPLLAHVQEIETNEYIEWRKKTIVTSWMMMMMITMMIKQKINMYMY